MCASHLASGLGRVAELKDCGGSLVLGRRYTLNVWNEEDGSVLFSCTIRAGRFELLGIELPQWEDRTLF